ncbi:hypothetical protein QWJ07_03890 [Frankia sp. RB7]|nr:hypothetical protein [Frankia sp. RB7]
MNKKILVALDLGTKTGIATFGLDGQLLTRNTLQFDSGSQTQNLFSALRSLLTPNMIVAFEQPFGRYGLQVLLPMVGAVQCACELIGCDDVPVNVVTVKKFATGFGLANKAAMIKAAQEKWGGEFTEHEADACWVGECALQTVLDTLNKKESKNA